jgi:hypothetical protein
MGLEYFYLSDAFQAWSKGLNRQKIKGEMVNGLFEIGVLAEKRVGLKMSKEETPLVWGYSLRLTRLIYSNKRARRLVYGCRGCEIEKNKGKRGKVQNNESGGY